MSNLPNGWSLVSIRDFARLVRRPVQLKDDEYYYQIGIRSHGLGIFHKEPITGKEIGTKRIFWVEPGDFVLNIVFAWEDAVALVSEAEQGMCASHRFPTFVVDKNRADARFLLRYFKSEDGIEQLKSVSPGGAGRNKTLNQSAFLRLKIPLPPVEEQRKIAAILSTWDEAITLTEQFIAALQRRKQALMQLLLTGEVRFQEFEAETWEETTLGEIATVKRGASPRPINNPIWFSDVGRAWVRIADVNASPTRYLNSASQYLSELGEERSVKIEVGELIMSIAATIGVPKIVNIPACIHDGFVVLRDYEDRAIREFLYHYLSLLTDGLANSGQPGTQKNLNSDLVREIEIPIPSLDEQQRIAEVLTECEEEIYLMGLVVEELQTQKRGMMQQLLSGAVRVNFE